MKFREEVTFEFLILKMNSNLPGRKDRRTFVAKDKVTEIKGW